MLLKPHINWQMSSRTSFFLVYAETLIKEKHLFYFCSFITSDKSFQSLLKITFFQHCFMSILFGYFPQEEQKVEGKKKLDWRQNKPIVT